MLYCFIIIIFEICGDISHKLADEHLLDTQHLKTHVYLETYANMI